MLLVLCMSACRKNTSCYDADLARQYQVVDCAAKYDPVVGCDVKTYENECIANTYGIRVK